MKKSELRKLIKEEVSLLQEGFISKTMANLANKYFKSNEYYKSQFFSSVSKKFNIEWDKVPEEAIEKITGNLTKVNPNENQLCFWVITKEKENPNNKYGLGTLRPGLGAVTRGKKFLDESGGIANKNKNMGNLTKPVGAAGGYTDSKLINNFKNLKIHSDIVYVLDLNKIKSDTVGGKRDARNNAKQGATALLTPKQVKDIAYSNMQRYKEILVSRKANISEDKFIKHIENYINKLSNVVINYIKSGANGDENNSKFRIYAAKNDNWGTDPGSLLNRILDLYSNAITQAKWMNKYKQKMDNFENGDPKYKEANADYKYYKDQYDNVVGELITMFKKYPLN